MTYATQIARGEGKFRAMVLVEGWPEIFVSDASLVGSSNETPARSQILGLDPQTVRIAASVDLVRAELTEQEQTFEIIDDSEVIAGYVLRSGVVTQSLSQQPALTTYLTANLLIPTTTVTVSSTAGWPTSGVLHIGTEAIQYTGVTPTTFTGCTRGRWGTTTQSHYTGDGERLAFPHVTSRPRSLRGRRVKVYIFGKSDAGVISANNLRWRGVASTDCSYSQGRYAFGVEPLSGLFEQSIGGDLEDPVGIRGVYLPNPGAIRFRVGLLTTGDRSAASFVSPAAMVTGGFFVDNEAVCTALTSAMATATSGWAWDADSSLTAEANADRWRLIYRVGSTTARYASVYLERTGPLWTSSPGASPVDLLAPESGTETVAQWIDPTTLAVAETLVAGQQYWMDFDAPVPRAVLGRDAVTARFFGGTSSPDVVYLGGGVVPTSYMMIGISADGEEDSELVPSISADSTARSVTVYSPDGAKLLGPRTRIRLARTLARDSTLSDLLIAIVLDSPGFVNTGAMPMLTVGDLDPAYGELVDAERDLRAAVRTWVTTEGVTLKELITHEARLLGVYPCPDATGLITWKRLRPPLRTDVAAFTLAASSIGPAMPSVSRSLSGNLREVVIRQGWDPIEGEHRGLTIRVRDVQGTDPTPLGGVLEIAPRSVATYRGLYGLELDPLDAELLAMPVLGLFGGAYRTVTVEAALVHFEETLGSVGVITTGLLPDSDGTMGLDQKECTLVGYDWSPFEGRGTLTLQLSELNIGGYAPQVLVASQSNDTGNQWTITLTLTGYTTESTIATWMAVGDEVRVMQRATASPTIVAGRVDAIAAATIVQVTFDGVWTPGTSSWFLGYDTTAQVDETAPATRRWAQIDFAKIGGTDAKAALGSGDVACQEFSP